MIGVNELQAIKRTILKVAALASAAAAGFAPCASSSAENESYPTRPIRLIVPVPPGAAQDILARTVGQKLSENVGRTVVIDNRPGGNGMMGMELVAKAAPNGYTLLLTSNALSVLPSLYSKMTFDVFNDFAPLCLVAVVPNIFVVNPAVPAKSVKDLVALAKARPGQLNFAAATAGGSVRLAGELFKIMAGIDIVMIPYKGGGLALNDVVGGQVHMGFPDALAVMPHIKAGRLRALGVTTNKRLASLPDVPTIAEAGVPGYDMAGWYGILAPAGTSKTIRSKLNGEIVKLLRAPELLEKLSSQEAIVVASSEDGFVRYLRDEYEKWAKVIKQAGIKAEQ